VEATVTIKGTNLSGATKVTFGGIRATTIVTDTATVLEGQSPEGSPDREDQGGDARGAAKSATAFRVT
jgi:hypothetical protein